MRLIPNNWYQNRVFSNTSIRSQIWFGFGLILAVLMVVSLSTLSVFNRLNNGISDVTERLQPVVLTAQNLETELEAASNALGSYILTREDNYRNSYVQRLGDARALADKLNGYDFVIENDLYASVVKDVQSGLDNLAAYQDRMIELVSNDIENVPAQRIASEKLNPMVQQLQSMISQMINSDYEEDNEGGERDDFRQAIYDLRYYNVQIASELRTFLAFRADANVQNMKALMEVVQKKLNYINESENLYTFEQSDLMDEFVSINKDYYSALNKAVEIHSTDRYRTDTYLIKTEIGPLVSEIESDLGSLVGQLKALIAGTSEELKKRASGAVDNLISGIIVGFILSVVISLIVARVITHPINSAVDAMKDLAEGEGDLTRRLNDTGRSEVSMMAKSFNNFAARVQGLVSQVADGIENLSAVVANVSSIVDQTQSGAQQQRKQTEQVATAITQMTATVQEVSSNADQASEAAQQADETAKSGQKVVDQTVSSIRSLADEIETSVNVVNVLSRDVVSIGSVLDVIKGVAEQTNLLALNAAIEAARAGEQGRGFAVVADEVRTLASRTQESTTEIENMIESLQEQADAAVDVITRGHEKARASVGNASDAGKALNEITNSVETISNMNIHIASASEQQSAVAEDINQNVITISHVADSNAEASNHLAATSDDLARLASELQRQVSQFKY